MVNSLHSLCIRLVACFEVFFIQPPRNAGLDCADQRLLRLCRVSGMVSCFLIRMPDRLQCRLQLFLVKQVPWLVVVWAESKGKLYCLVHIYGYSAAVDTHSPIRHGAAWILCDCALKTASGLFVVECITPYQSTIKPCLCRWIGSCDCAVEETQVVLIGIWLGPHSGCCCGR
jgi:hypothetical protein